jgi:hypothetical protein
MRERSRLHCSLKKKELQLLTRDDQTKSNRQLLLLLDLPNRFRHERQFQINYHQFQFVMRTAATPICIFAQLASARCLAIMGRQCKRERERED